MMKKHSRVKCVFAMGTFTLLGAPLLFFCTGMLISLVVARSGIFPNGQPAFIGETRVFMCVQSSEDRVPYVP